MSTGELRQPTTHDEDCDCVRCVGFTPGPTGTAALAPMTHGARSIVQIRGRAAEVEDALIAALRSEDLWRPSFAPTVALAAVVLVRVERAHAAIAQVDETTADHPLASYHSESAQAIEKLRSDLRGWTNTARQYLSELGLSPTALARIARDTGQGQAARASAAIRALADHVEREHSNGTGS